MIVDGINVGEFQEVLYDDLTVAEKSTFDVFFTTFTK
jgi:hypothetical protein